MGETSRSISNATISSTTSRANTVIVQVSGMHCEGCVYKLEKAFAKLKNVKECKVDLDTQQIHLVMSESNSSAHIDRFKSTIEDNGYQFVSIL